MEQSSLTQLDNPVWNALQTQHQSFAIGTSAIRRYPADMLPFLAVENGREDVLHEIFPYVSPGEQLYIVGDLPVMPQGCLVVTELNCAQMACGQPVHVTTVNEMPVIELHPDDRDEMFRLINDIQPGYFKKKTPALGSSYGIRVNGKLVAMAGERLKIDGYHEISAVCTHPSFTGKGFAQQLVAHASDTIRENGAIPFLHVLNSNTRAIGLYELLGFQKRRDIPFRLVAFPG